MPKGADKTESLLDRTKRLLENRGDLTLRQIADGAEVGYEWLRKFAYEGIENPGVVSIEKVHDYLTGYQAAKKFELQRSSAAQ